MSDFTRISNHNPHANFKSVRIGADAPVLEVELNELQDIAEQRTKDLISTYFGDGLNGQQDITYDVPTRTVTINGGGALVQGNTIKITTLNVEASHGDIVYLKVWEQTVSFNDPIYYLGNVQEHRLLENTLIDDRVGKETSRRIQVQYDLVTDNSDPNATYLEIGRVEETTFVVTATLKSEEQRVSSERFVPLQGQQVVTLSGHYHVNTNALLVFVDGVLQYPSIHYTELNTSQIRFVEAFDGTQEVFIQYTKLNIKRNFSGSHSNEHSKDGIDPLDITELADKTGIFAKIQTQLQAKNIDGGNFIDDDIIEDETFDGGYF